MYQNSKTSKFRTLFCAAMLLSMGVSSTHANLGFNQLINRIFSRLQPEQRQDWLMRLSELAKKMGLKAIGRVHNEPEEGAYSTRHNSLVAIPGRYLDLPKSQLDFVLAHELGHLKQPLLQSQWIPLLLQVVTVGIAGTNAVTNIWSGRLPGFRKLFGAIVIYNLLEKWEQRTNEYNADARAVRALQSTEGAIARMRSYQLYPDHSGFRATANLIALPLDWCFERFVAKNLERKLMAGYEELSEKDKKFRDRMLLVTEVASRFLGMLACLRVGGMIANRLEKRNLIFNGSSHPTGPQRIEALRRLNLK